jgi:hypothetical protein
LVAAIATASSELGARGYDPCAHVSIVAAPDLATLSKARLNKFCVAKIRKLSLCRNPEAGVDLRKSLQQCVDIATNVQVYDNMMIPIDEKELGDVYASTFCIGALPLTRL